MAFSNAPVQSTYSSHQIPLVYDYQLMPAASSMSVDSGRILQGMHNIIPYKKKGTEELYGMTRSGLVCNVVTATAGMVCRGMYTWEKTAATAYIFVVYGDGTNSYVVTSSNYGSTWGPPLFSWADTTTTPCRFTEYIDDTNTKKLVLLTGTKGYVFTSSAAAVEITDVDFPSPHLPFPVFLNGRIYVAKKDTGDIYNSALNDPTSWTAGDYISSEIYPDDLQALVKIQNYILAIGISGCEYFYDNANASGSPLARQEGASLPFGCIFPNSIASNKDTAMMLATTGAGDPVFMLVNDFQYEEIAAPALMQVLTTQLIGSLTNDNVRGMFTRQQGELLYIFNFNGSGTSDGSDPTMCYSFSSKMWCRLSVEDEATTFPVFFTCQGNREYAMTFVAGRWDSIGIFFGRMHDTTENDSAGSIYAIPQYIYVAPQTFGTMNRKFMHRLAINYDKYSSGSPSISVSYSDNNMGATGFSTARTLGNIAGADGGFPFLTQLGSFRSRGFKLGCTEQVAIKWNYMEVDINKGQQ